MENWKDIKGFEGLYQVSDHGRIRSLDKVVRNRHSTRISKGRVLKPGIGTSGYYCINLALNGQCHRSKMVHRLEALEFLGHENSHLTVNHKDGNRLNNHIDNLEMVTQSKNNEHKRDILGKKGGRNVSGKKNPMFGRRHSDKTKSKIKESWRRKKSN